MKRSRACDDLVALAAETSDHNSNLLRCWPPFGDGPTHRLKRTRAAVRSSCGSVDKAEDHRLQERPSSQFALEMNDCERFSKDVTLSSSVPSHSSVQDDDSLPLRRNSRENMLLRKKKQRIADITNSFSDFSIHDKDVSGARTPTRHQSLVETPEPRILRSLCCPRKTRCIDPLDKRQAQSFDLSALIMLSFSPKR